MRCVDVPSLVEVRLAAGGFGRGLQLPGHREIPQYEFLLPRVAVLYARKDSIYNLFPFCDVYDIDRDARTFSGGLPVITHPPCRAWGQLRSFAKPRHDEKELAFHAIQQVRKYGGILEHPLRSSFWDAAKVPLPGRIDEFGGFRFPILQKWFGHRAEKPTYLYVCGVQPKDVPPTPISLKEASHVIAQNSRSSAVQRPEVSKAEREHTPLPLCTWLVRLALNCQPQNSIKGVFA